MLEPLDDEDEFDEARAGAILWVLTGFAIALLGAAVGVWLWLTVHA